MNTQTEELDVQLLLDRIEEHIRDMPKGYGECFRHVMHRDLHDTAEIIGAAKAEFATDETVKQLLSHPAAEATAPAEQPSSTKETPKLARSFGDLRVEIQSAFIANHAQYVLTVSLTNANPNRSIWITVDAGEGAAEGPVKAALNDSGGNEFGLDSRNISGLGFGVYYKYLGFQGSVTEIKPHEAVTATLKFSSIYQREATSGDCNVQIQFLLLHTYLNNFNGATKENFVGKITVN